MKKLNLNEKRIIKGYGGNDIRTYNLPLVTVTAPRIGTSANEFYWNLFRSFEQAGQRDPTGDWGFYSQSGTRTIFRPGDPNSYIMAQDGIQIDNTRVVRNVIDTWNYGEHGKGGIYLKILPLAIPIRRQLRFVMPHQQLALPDRFNPFH